MSTAPTPPPLNYASQPTQDVIQPLQPTFDRPIPDEPRLAFNLSGGWAMMIVTGVMVCIAMVLAGVIVFQIQRDSQYRTDGQTVMGDLISKHVRTSTTSKGSKTHTYLVRYRFMDPQGRLFDEEEDVGSDHYGNLQPGRQHPVEFLPADTSVHRLVLNRSHTGRWVMGSIATALVVIAYFVFTGYKASGRRRAGVIYHGQATPGQIVVSEQRGSGKNRRYVLGYRYMGLDGREQHAKEFNVSSRVMNQFPRGTLITVVIDPKDQGRPEPDLYGVRHGR